MTCGGDIGGHECNWVEDPPDELLCLICLCIAKDPCQHGEGGCGKLFCQSCVKEHEQRNELCPNCRCLFVVHRDVRSRKQVRRLQVKCDKMLDGCQWIGLLGALDNHLLKKCAQAYTPCPKGCLNNNKCVKVLRKNLRRHLKYRCPKRNERDVLPPSFYRQRSSSDSQSEPELEKQLSDHLQECSQKSTDSMVSMEESVAFSWESGHECSTLVFPRSVENGDLYKFEENPGHAHLPLFSPSHQDILSKDAQSFVKQCDGLGPVKPRPTGPVCPPNSSVISLSEYVVPHSTDFIKVGSSGGKVPLSTWVRDVATPTHMWRLCCGLVHLKKMRQLDNFQLNDEAFSKILMDDEGIAHIPDDITLSTAAHPCPSFVIVVAGSVRTFLDLPRNQLKMHSIEMFKMMAFVNTYEKCANFHDVLLQLGTIKYRTEKVV